jgi:hydrogenase nickel incorporation protein HypA/HybF
VVHELAITESVIEAITDRVGDIKVTRVLLEIGKLSGVVPDAVRFCFDIAADGTPLAGPCSRSSRHQDGLDAASAARELKSTVPSRCATAAVPTSNLLVAPSCESKKWR